MPEPASNRGGVRDAACSLEDLCFLLKFFNYIRVVIDDQMQIEYIYIHICVKDTPKIMCAIYGSDIKISKL